MTNSPARHGVDQEAESSTRVLVIEDDDNDQQLLLRQLKKANLNDHVLFIKDGRKAVDLLKQEGPGIRSKLCAVFLDLKLPGMSGIDILRFIRSTPEISGLPVIVMTGSTHPGDLEECRRLKATSYIPKPIAFQSFCMAVANVFHLPVSPAQGNAGRPLTDLL